jgi:bifunctional non-homologous end joining protein LigD
MRRAASRRGLVRDLHRIPGAQKASYPGFVEPCLATLRADLPERGEWIHEIKYDGYRAQAHLINHECVIYTRRGYDWSDTFAPIADGVRALPAQDAIIDGEVVVPDERGIADYHLLQADLAKGRTDRLAYFVFDLLYLEGYDLRACPLVTRKRLLSKLLSSEPRDTRIRLSEHLEGNADAVLKSACALHLEGIVSKERNSVYRSDRQDSWIKLKCSRTDTFPIIAFVEKLGASPRRIASLYLGRWEGEKLLYAGKAQTGFKHETLYELRERLDPYIRKTSPLSVPVRKPKATWVEPVVEAEIEYSSLTADQLLRAPVFRGIREDLLSPEVARPTRAPTRTRASEPRVPKENILQLLPDAVVPTREELAAYWRKVADEALEYIARRPLKLVRHTRGTTFYHMGKLPPIPASVHQLRIEKRGGGTGTRLWVDDLEGLLGLVSIGAVELHAWNSTVDHLEHPDVLVFDLDPGPGIEWEFVTDTAALLRDLLQSEGLESWPKLTGGKGVHIMVPLDRRMTHDEAHRYSRTLAERLAATAPNRYTTTAASAERERRLFLDYLRNGRGTTAVATYSPRARPGFPIAAPTSWKALEAGIAPDAFTLAQPFRLRRRQASAKRNLHDTAGFSDSPRRGVQSHERRQKPARRARQQTH